MFGQGEAVSSQNLSENLRGDFKVSVVIEVLEEALCIKSVFTNNFLEISNDFLYNNTLFICWLLAAIISSSASIIQYNINWLFKFFLSENLIDLVREYLPLNMFTFFWRLEMFS